MPTKKSSVLSRDQQYATFLRGIKLSGFGLQESRTVLNRDAYAALYEKERLTYRISTDYHTAEVEKDFFNASAKLKLNVEDKKGVMPEAVLIECTFETHFHCDGCRITRDLAERFTESELRLVVWPYFRQFVNDATARMTIQPILIPFSAVS
jgi:preprotein translocase subunit SecB